MKHEVKKSFFGLLLCLIFVAVITVGIPVKSSAAINSQINFQGKITNPDGTNIADASYTIVFSIYNVASAGTAQWTETDVVPVASGIFQVSLGAGTTLPGAVDFNTASIYLGIKVGADAEMTPRVRFTASPYAFNSDKVGGFTAAQLVQLSPGSAQVGSINVTGAIATASTLTVQGASALTLGSTANVGAILFQDGTANNRTITLNTPALGASYSLTLPTAAPGTSQCLQAGAVTASQLAFAACSGNTATLQNGYDNSGMTTPQITLSAVYGGLKVQDAITTVGNLLQISNNGNTVTYLAVTNAGVTTNGLTVAGTTNINTTGAAATTIGSTGSTVAIASSALNISSAGVISGATGLTSSGTITFSGLGTGVVQSAAGVLSSGTATVANGGTGAATLALNGILFGNGTGAVQVTAAAANSILATNGTNVPALTAILPPAVQGNITALGTIALGVNIATGQTYKINGVDINTAGTLNNIAYLSQANTFSAAGTALTVTNNASVGGTLTTGTLGVTGNATVTGTLGVTSTSTFTGLVTANGGLTVVGAANINVTGTAATTIGNATSAVSIASTALNVSSAGVISGVTGYTQASGNFGISGTGTFGTGTGLVALNGATTITNASAAATSLTINSSTTVPTVDQVAISNASSTGVTTANINGLRVNYLGGAAAVEAAGFRVDYAPGGTSGGTWSGVRIVSNQTTGAATGVNSYGIKLEGTTAAHTGNQTAVAIATGWDIGLDVQSGGIQLASLASDPATPTGSNLRVYSKLTAGRAMLRAKAPTGVSYNYQTSLADQSVAFVTPGNGAAATTFANISSVGAQWANSATTGFTIAAANQTVGSGMSMTTAATAGTNASTATQNQFFRGSAAGSNGFFSFARVATPDANYGTGATGARMFVGLTDQTMAVMLGADAPAAGNFIGFQFSTNRADTAWQVIRRDGTTTAAVTATTAAAGAAGQQNHVYDFYLFTPGFGQTGAGTVFWRADDLVAGTTSEGSFATTLPTNSVAMKQGMGIQTLTTTARIFQMNKMYIESDR